jgi:hypothetical protein
LSAEDIAKHLAVHIALLPTDWSDRDTDVFCSWVCRFGRLTIGAVSSLALSNTG